MAHSRSAEKRYRQSLDRQVRNRSVRSATRTHITKALGLIKAGVLPEAEAAVREAASVLDQAQKKGVIHANNAARRKSRIMARYNAALAAAAQAEAEAKARAEAPPPEEPVEVGRRGRLGRKPAEKPPARAAKPAAAAKGSAKPSKAPAKKEDKPKPKKKEDKPKPKKKEDKDKSKKK